MRAALIDVAEPLIPALIGGIAGGIRLAESPLAGHASCVAGLLQNRGHGLVFGAQRDAVLAAAQPGDPARHAEIPPNARMPGVQSSHQNAAGRGANRRSGVDLGEAQSLLGQAVDIRGLDDFLPVAPGVAVTHVVGHDEDDVRLGVSGVQGSA